MTTEDCREDPLLAEPEGSEALGAWFLGPLGENEELFKQRVDQIVSAHVRGRIEAYDDPPWVTDQVKNSDDYKAAARVLETELGCLLERLRGSVPFFSYRYQGHMLWDTTIPAILGYFAAMLYNQNNVAAEASPVTTPLEKWVGTDLCRMLGYSDRSWGHITCDGSVANMEALWAARNLKAFPAALAAAIRAEPTLAPALGLAVEVADGRQKPLLELDPWELVNLKADVVLALPRRLLDEFGVSEEALELTKRHTLQRRGIGHFLREHGDLHLEDLAILAPGTCHYSLPKGASLLGLGEGNLVSIAVDKEARMSEAALRQALDDRLLRRRPVMAVVTVLGTTQESAVDPLARVVALRDEYRQQGLDFLIHVDAAWGGYFASLLREPRPNTRAALSLATATNTAGESETSPWAAMASSDGAANDSAARMDQSRQGLVFTPEMVMSRYVKEQYVALPHADSVTIDPHKAGYIPYPAGALCYRDSRMRDLVAFTAHVVYHGKDEPTVGLFGIEGSKPGAAAAATWLSHRVIRTDKSGYGRILGRCMFNSIRLYMALVTMADPDDPFVIKPIQRIPIERGGGDPDAVAKELLRIHHLSSFERNQDLAAHLEACPDDKDLFRELGPDQLIIAYAFNFKDAEGKLNDDPEQANRLNKAIFDRLSRTREPAMVTNCPGENLPLIITHSKFDPAAYGADFVRSFMRRLGLGGPPRPIDFLISTTMDPWLTDTSGDPPNMVPKLVHALRLVVTDEVEKLRPARTDDGRK